MDLRGCGCEGVPMRPPAQAAAALEAEMAAEGGAHEARARSASPDRDRRKREKWRRSRSRERRAPNSLTTDFLVEKGGVLAAR